MIDPAHPGLFHWGLSESAADAVAVASLHAGYSPTHVQSALDTLWEHPAMTKQRKESGYKRYI